MRSHRIVISSAVACLLLASAVPAIATNIALTANNPYAQPAAYTYGATAASFNDGNTSSPNDYFGVLDFGGSNPHATMGGGYDLGGIATVNSVTIYQTDLGRGPVTDWRVWYNGGSQDFTGVAPTATLTFSSPVTTGFVSVAALNGSTTGSELANGNRAFAEIQVDGAAPAIARPDLAAGKSFTMSSYSSAFGTAAITTHNLLSSDNNAAWNPTTGAGNNYLQIDLGTAQSIGGFGLLQVGGGSGRSMLDSIRFSFSNDPTFTLGVTSQDITLSNREYYAQGDLTSVTAQYVRMTALTKFANEDGNWGVTRLQLFGPTVPEPSSLVLLGFGSLFMMFVVRRRR